ncbi:MAG: crotonase/enoyl-CoA hydratase family protein [Proteobacteria bacterium]|nr:crotonase/enoyl-CoA hydratase family protein [Pseudomonadota bacterium]
MTDFICFESTDGIALLTLSSPHTRNALSSDTEYDAIEAACRRIQRDRSIRVAVLTGSGPTFCAGGNIKDMAERARDGGIEAVEDRYVYRDGIHRIPRAFYDLEVPTIAAVNGPAIGAGLDLACMCDIRIAGETARFAESFVKLGIIPGDGGAWLLQRIVGLSKAAEMTFTGDVLTAEEALACGLVSRVVADHDLVDEAMALARRIADNPGHALRMAKRLMHEAQTARLETILEMSAAFQALAHATGDHRERIESAVGQLGKRKS